MHANRIGWGNFPGLSVECLEIFEDGVFVQYLFSIDGEYFQFYDLVQMLERCYPTLSSLLSALGLNKFVEAVLDWDPSDDRTKDSFYRYLAYEANAIDDWD